MPIAVTLAKAGNEIFTPIGGGGPGPIVVAPGESFQAQAGVSGGEWVCTGNTCKACSHLLFEHLSWVSQKVVGVTSDCDLKCGAGQFCTGLGETGVCRTPTADCGGCPGGHTCSFGTCYPTALTVTDLFPSNPAAAWDFDTNMVHDIALQPGWQPPADLGLDALPHFWVSFRTSYTISSPVPCDPSNPDLVTVRSFLVTNACE